MAGWTDKFKGDYFPADDGFVRVVRQEPLGVCVGINAFNSPVASFIIKSALCLATGSIIIIKPSEKSPLGSLALGPLVEVAGFPKGVVQVLSGDGTTGALLASHMRVRKVSFTGSVATGKKIQVAATQSNLKHVTLELGGKSPADLQNALTWQGELTINAILARSGQVCVAASRVSVHKDIADAFIKKYKQRMAEAVNRVGDPQASSTQLGQLVDADALDRVRIMVEQGRRDAELVVGGVRYGKQGCFMEPTVLLNPRRGSDIYTKEIFGPVAIIKSFEDEEEVIRLANDTEYGLMAGVFTRTVRCWGRWLQLVSYMNMQAPFGGKVSSRLGREMGEYALRAYTEPKTVLINMNVETYMRMFR